MKFVGIIGILGLFLAGCSPQVPTDPTPLEPGVEVQNQVMEVEESESESMESESTDVSDPVDDTSDLFGDEDPIEISL